MWWKRLICSLFILFHFTTNITSQILKSTDWGCSKQKLLLECPNYHMIVLTQFLHKYTPSQCVSYDYVDFNVPGDDDEFSSLDHCLSKRGRNAEMESVCNGRPLCAIHLRQEKHRKGANSNCNFVSNLQNVHYACLPQSTQRFKLANFDICDPNGPATLLADTTKGWIHSPGFPAYYGNNRKCELSVRVPRGKRLSMFLINLSLEHIGIFTSRVKDYVKIGEQILYGKSAYPLMVYNETGEKTVKIEFISDWVTTSFLQNPKGFLIYFEIEDKQVRTTTTTTTTSTTTTEEPVQVISTGESVSELSDFKINVVDELAKKVVDESGVVNAYKSSVGESSRSRESESHFTTFVLSGVIIVLVMIIMALLLVNKRKQQQNIEDNMYYDNTKTKSKIGADEYHYEYETGDQISVVHGVAQDKEQPTGVGQRLRHFYSNMSQNLHFPKMPFRRGQEQKKEQKQENVEVKVAKENETKQTKKHVDTFNTSQTPLHLKEDRSGDQSILNQSDRMENDYVSNPLAEEHQGRLRKSDSLPVYESLPAHAKNITPNLNFSSLYSSVNDLNKHVSQEKLRDHEENVEIYQSISEFDLEKQPSGDEAQKE